MGAVSYRWCQVASEQVETPTAPKSPWGLVTPGHSLCLRDVERTNPRHCPAVTTQVTLDRGAAARQAEHRTPGRTAMNHYSYKAPQTRFWVLVGWQKSGTQGDKRCRDLWAHPAGAQQSMEGQIPEDGPGHGGRRRKPSRSRGKAQLRCREWMTPGKGRGTPPAFTITSWGHIIPICHT